MSGLEGLRFPFLPRHLTLISTLTIGLPAFVLALAPSTQRVEPGFVARVGTSPCPPGSPAPRPPSAPISSPGVTPGAGLVADRTTAVITLAAVALWVLALVARPYTWWRITLVAAMAAGFLPRSRATLDTHLLQPAPL